MSQAIETIVRRSPNTVVTQLRVQAATDPVFNAVAHRFAIRERARAQITIASLRATMGKEGFDFPVAKYQAVLSFLASLGVGTLEYSKNKKIKALKNIKTTLQSIGLAAISKTDTLEAFTVANRYQPLPVVPLKAQEKVLAQPVLTVLVDGKIVNFPLPRPLSTEELGYVLADIYATSSNTTLKGQA